MLIEIMFDIVNNIFHLTTPKRSHQMSDSRIGSQERFTRESDRKRPAEAKFHIHKCTFSGQIYVL